MTIGRAPMCVFCKHFREAAGLPCDAFPLGVPDGILMGGYDHREPYEGDNGIMFELIEGKELEFAKYLDLRSYTRG